MSLGEKLNKLVEFIDESLRRKLFCARFFEFFQFLGEDFSENNILDIKSFYILFNAAKNYLFYNYLKSRDLKKELESFLSDNPDINRFIERNDMVASVIITDLDYQLKCFDKLDKYISENKLNFNKTKQELIEYVDFLISELTSIFQFKDTLLEAIEKHSTCYACGIIASYQCKICNRNMCKKHQLSGYCLKCAKALLKEKKI